MNMTHEPPVQPVLQVEDFAKHFYLHEQQKKIPSASGVSFSVWPGKLTALIGPTGAGKSSVLKGIYRTYLPTQGKILFRHADGSTTDLATAGDHEILNLRRQQIGFVTQFLHCLPRQPALDVVAQPLLHKGESLDEARLRAGELLASMNLPERLWSLSPSTFSGGERQRVNLAHGLIMQPRLLLLDEPTASLDPVTSLRVVDLLEALKAQGTAMLAIFHQPDLTQRLADEVVELAPPADIVKTSESTREVTCP